MYKSSDEMQAHRTDLIKSFGYSSRSLDAPVRYGNRKDHDARAIASFAAIEVLAWFLISQGVLPAKALADELARYACLNPEAERLLRLLVRVVAAAAPERED